MRSAHAFLAALIALLLLPLVYVLPLVYANECVSGTTCATDFYENPTAAQLTRITEPTLAQFQMLNPVEQRTYLMVTHDQSALEEEYLTNRPTLGAQDFDIAQRFFTREASAVNRNRALFTTYLKATGVGVADVAGDIVEFRRDGTIVGTDGALNVRDFAEGGALAEQYQFAVNVDGTFRLVYRGDDTVVAVPFTGTLVAAQDGSFSIAEGTLLTYAVRQASGIRITAEGISGTTQQFGGMTLTVPSTFTFSHNTLTLDGADIAEIDEGTALSVRGTAQMASYQGIDGTLSVSPGEMFTLNGIEVRTATDTLPAVSLPSRGYYLLGDRSDTLIQIQEALQRNGYLSGTPEFGVYDATTVDAIKRWQEDTYTRTGTCIGTMGASGCAPDGLFGSRSQREFNAHYLAETSSAPVRLVFGNQVPLRFTDPHSVVGFADTLTFHGEGFSVGFSPQNLLTSTTTGAFIALPARGVFQKGDYPLPGSAEAMSIANIQRLVGATDDGKYGPGTSAKVGLWKERIFAETGNCLGTLSGGSCTVDGNFDAQSVTYAMGSGSAGSPGESLISISPHGGTVRFGLSPEGIDASFTGAADFRLGNRQFSLNGQDISEELIHSLFSTGVQVPTQIAFADADGNPIGNPIRTFGADSFFSPDLSSTDILRSTALAGINPSKAQCAGTVCVVFAMQGDDGRPYGRLGDRALSEQAGTHGSAWDMSSNMVESGGTRVFWSEGTFTPEERQQLDVLRADMQRSYEAQLGTFSALAVSNPVEYTRRHDALIRSLSAQYRTREGEVLNRPLESPVDLRSGDVLSMYYRDSNYLAEAMLTGEDAQKNTHVGVVTGFTEQTFRVSGVSNVPEYLRSQLRLTDSASLYVNQYYVRPAGQTVFEPALLRDGQFYRLDGTPVPSSEEITVRRPEVSHMIHYSPGEANPFHIEPLDGAVDRKDIALYAVTRSSDELQAQIAAARPNPDTVTVAAAGYCPPAQCGTLDPLERARADGFPPTVLAALEHDSAAAEIPAQQLPAFRAAMLSVLSIEGGTSQRIGHAIERQFSDTLNTLSYVGMASPSDSVLSALSGLEITDMSEGTYTQVKPSTLREAGEILGRDTSGINLRTDEGSVEGTAVVLEAIFKRYIPADRTVLTDDDVRVVAAAWNGGINSNYARQLAARNYGRLPTVNPQSGASLRERLGGLRGELASAFMQLRGYDTAGYFNAYPERFTEAYQNYCC